MVKSLAHFSPGRVIFFSVLITIVAGTLALALPIARTQPIPILDLFFTATSATCVTGLFTIPLDHFTHVGHIIILLLTQIGGLGLITLTIFTLSLFVNFGFATQVMAGKLLEIDSWKNIRTFIIFIIGLTFAVELIGAACLLPILMADYSFGDACFLAIFHSVTSFCNAGISLFEGGGLVAYATSYGMLLITIVLMFIGSFGFITWHDIMEHARAKFHHKWHPLALNTKIIIYSTALLLITSTLMLYLLERHHAFAGMSVPLASVNALFHAVAARSAGILTVDVGALHLASLFFILLMAFIGAAPSSTGSGVRITTFAVFISTIKAAIFGRTSVEIRGRSIGIDQVYKAIAIVSLSIMWVIITTFCLLLTDGGFGFFPLFLEALSAFATLGLSTGIAASLSVTGKIFIIASMLVGRIGSLTLVLALRELRHKHGEKAEFSYPEERVILS